MQNAIEQNGCRRSDGAVVCRGGKRDGLKGAADVGSRSCPARAAHAPPGAVASATGG